MTSTPTDWLLLLGVAIEDWLAHVALAAFEAGFLSL